MANLKDIKTRIQSVQNTKKITRAMKMVAAAKVKRAETTVKAARPFADELLVMFRRMLSAVNGEYSLENLHVEKAIDNYPVLLEKRDIKSVGLVVMTSNKGLAGAYNANIIRRTLAMVDEYNEKGLAVKLFVVGQKGVGGLKRKIANKNCEIVKTYLSVANNVTSTGALLVAEDLAEFFVDNKIDKIEVLTTRFKNMMSYSVQNWEILPLSPEIEENDGKGGIDPLMLFEPNVHGILQSLVPMFITNIIYQALLEAQASELASRMTAMSAASNNAEEMIRLLSIDYNKARQWAITQELVEIVSGANALK
ncbi:MAG: ATP synthase F1 subunit gamma [Candidatus Melainabacteria bacterium]|nr:MAG: ATP synthase F1 subunit gamma [Candidatus Melainabacteria bacterium]